MTTQTFDPDALQACIVDVQTASATLDEARANCTAARQALDAAEVAFENAKQAAVAEIATQAGVGPFSS